MRIPELNFYKDETNNDRTKNIRRSSLNNFSSKKRPAGLSIVILNLDKPEYIIPLCEQLKSSKSYFLEANVNFEIIIGDTGSTHPKVLSYFEKNQEALTVMGGLKYNFSSCNNLAYDRSNYSTVLFLNNDIRFDCPPHPLLWEMYETLTRHSSLSILGSYLYFDDGRIQHAGIDFFRQEELRGFCYHPDAGKITGFEKETKYLTVPAVTGAFLMMKSANFELCNGFNEAYAAECQDVDLCLKNECLGFSAGIVKMGKVTHFENGTRRKGEENWRDRRIFMRKWASFIEAVYL